MSAIYDLLLELVGVQSDTGTTQELVMAAKLHALIRDQAYFAGHPDQCGTFECGDALGRPVVWALRRGTGRRTVILAGHYDAVDLEPYGWLKPYALDPAQLRARLRTSDIQDPGLARDLEDEAWGFGRGMADMKAGLAINLDALFTLEGTDVNLLFLAVPDEENMSSGALQSVALLHQLKDRFGLDYLVMLLTEPQIRSAAPAGRELQMVGGTMGKMLPVVLARGVVTHSAEILKGLNASYMLTEIVRRVELTTDLVSEHLGVFTQPPTVQIHRDLKTMYDVSVPEYAAACFNFLFLKSRPPLTLLQDLERLCREAMEDVLERYQGAFDVMAAKGFIAPGERRRFQPEVLTLAQLERRIRDRDQDFATFKGETTEGLKKDLGAGRINLPGASIQYPKALAERARLTGPAVLIGISPPYYPAVHHPDPGPAVEAALADLGGYLRDRHGIELRRVPYLSGMTDLSYTSSEDPAAERRFLDSLALPRDIYDVPVEAIAQLDIPAFLIGPAGRDVHKRGERVYLPDVTTHVPDLIRRLVTRL